MCACARVEGGRQGGSLDAPFIALDPYSKILVFSVGVLRVVYSIGIRRWWCQILGMEGFAYKDISKAPHGHRMIAYCTRRAR